MTLIWPFITFWPWIVQKNVSVPAVDGVNWTVRDWPAGIAPESAMPLIVNVWGAGPEFVTEIIRTSPARVLKDAGENAKSRTVTACCAWFVTA